MFKRNIFIFIFTVCSFILSFTFSSSVHAVNSIDLQWMKTYGGSSDDYFEDIKPTSDGGFIAVGSSASNNGDLSGNKGGQDGIIAKFDKNGNKLWIKNYGGSSNDYFDGVQIASDGSIIAVGSTSSINGDLSSNNGGTDWMIGKFDSNGNKIWIKSYGTNYYDQLYKVQILPDGNYVAAGYGNTATSTKASIVKFDQNGNEIWFKLYGGTNLDVFTSLSLTNDGNVIAAGYGYSNNGDLIGNHGLADFFIGKFDQNGNKIWTKTYGGSGYDYIENIIQTNDDGFAAVGISSSSDGDLSTNKGGWDAILAKFDNNGNKEWIKNFGGSQSDYFYDVFQSSDNGFITTGTSFSNDGDVFSNRGSYDAIIAKFDSSGNKSWLNVYGGSGDDEFDKIIPLSENRYIVTGWDSSSNIPFSATRGGEDLLIAQFKQSDIDYLQTNVGIQAGSLSINPPTISNPFSNITLNGSNQTISATLSSFSVTDSTGSGNGYNVIVSASPFTEFGGIGYTFPIGSLSLQSPSSISANSIPASLPIIEPGAPWILDSGSSMKILSAGVNTGSGQYTINLPVNNLTLSLNPQSVKVDTVNFPSSPTPYRSIMTWTIISGP